jgi:DivIVA domain-containing protein
VPAAIRDVSFPSAARGYERRAVDAYVNQVNRLIAELEVSRSPQAAVRHALERVGEQTKALDEIHGMGTRLLEVASGAAARVSPREPPAPAEAVTREPAPAAETEPTGALAMDEALGEISIATSHGGSEEAVGEETE